MDDIRNEHRSIRDIPVSSSRQHRTVLQAQPTHSHTTAYKRPRIRVPHWFWWALGGAAVMATVGAFLLSTFFVHTTILVYPRTQKVTMPTNIVVAAHPAKGELQGAIISTKVSATTTARATGMQRVSRQATGVLSVYNTYSSASQRLITNTRFAAPDGKIYRIRTSVVVPGTTKKQDGTIQPGIVSVPVFADAAGVEYNRSTTGERFSIPGFEGDPRYKSFYALSEGPIMDGFVGDEPAIAPADLTTAAALLKNELDKYATDAADAHVPEGYLVIPGTLRLGYDNIVKSAAGGSDVQLTQSATVTALTISTADLATLVASKTVTGYQGESVRFSSFEGVSMAPQSAASAALAGPITINTSGTTALVWEFDQDALRQALLGKPKASFQTVIESFRPAVASAEARIRPLWVSSFPQDVADMSITIASPETR